MDTKRSSTPTGDVSHKKIVDALQSEHHQRGAPLEYKATPGARLDAVIRRLYPNVKQFESGAWGESGSAPYRLDTFGDKARVTLVTGDGRIMVGIGESLDAAVSDLESQEKKS